MFASGREKFMVIKMTVNFTIMFVESDMFLSLKFVRLWRYKFGTTFVAAEAVRMESTANSCYDTTRDRLRANFTVQSRRGFRANMQIWPRLLRLIMNIRNKRGRRAGRNIDRGNID